MYKGTSEKQNFIGRVASHSTKGYANGRVVLLPAEARREQTYQSTKEQYEIAKAELRELEPTIPILKKKLVKTLPYKEYSLISNEISFAMMRQQELKTILGELRLHIRNRGESSYGGIFYRIAKQRLSKDILIEIEKEVSEALGRHVYEIKKAARKNGVL
jgi:hypothetical protein